MVNTRQQKRAETASQCVSTRSGQRDEEAYSQLARKFPALVHTCGLAQAIAFVQAKEGDNGARYIQDLSMVMALPPNQMLTDKSRTAPLMEYQHLTREATESATWIKRYAETYLKKGSA